MKKKMTKAGKGFRLLMYVFTSIISAVVMVCTLFATRYLFDTEATFELPLFLMLTFLFLGLSRLPMAIHAVKREPNKVIMIKNFSFAAIYIAMSLIIIINKNNFQLYSIICAIYLATIAVNRICLLFERKEIFKKLFNGLLALAAGALSFTFFVETEYAYVIMTSLTIILFVSIIETLAFAFLQIQLKGLIKIMRKTYVFEILYGLLVLIFTFSFYFLIMEENINSYGDALWYSFAIITTIGLGDITVTSPVSRILSVVLGVYGIIVVAALTSVIVNFYNETKDKEKNKKGVEEIIDDKNDRF